MAKLNAKTVAKLIRETKGNVSAIARKMDHYRQAVWEYINKNPELKQLLQDAREELVDNCETQLHVKVRRGDWKAISFTLRTIGKGRGYVFDKKTDDGKFVQVTEMDEQQILELAEFIKAKRAAEGKANEGGEATSSD